MSSTAPRATWTSGTTSEIAIGRPITVITVSGTSSPRANAAFPRRQLDELGTGLGAGGERVHQEPGPQRLIHWNHAGEAEGDQRNQNEVRQQREGDETPIAQRLDDLSDGQAQPQAEHGGREEDRDGRRQRLRQEFVHD